MSVQIAVPSLLKPEHCFKLPVSKASVVPTTIVLLLIKLLILSGVTFISLVEPDSTGI